jgi:murein DD-endopeptidase MepM/ murein hydrolase activator NlpD
MRRRTRISLVAALVAALGLGVVVPVHADDIDDRLAAAKKSAADQEAKLDQLEADLDETTLEYQAAVVKLTDAQAKLPVAQAELDRANADLEAAQREAEVLAGRLSDAEAEQAAMEAQVAANAVQAEAAREQIAQLARQSLRNAGSLTTLGLVTGAQSTDDFLAQYSVSSSAARAQSRTVTEIQDAQAEALNQEARLVAIEETITQLKAAADENVIVQQDAQAAAEARKAEVDALIAQEEAATAAIEAERDTVLANLDLLEAARKQTEQDIINLQAEQKARDEEIARKKAEAEAAARAAALAGRGPAYNGVAGALQFPLVSIRKTSDYGVRWHPIYGGYRLHAGTDFAANCGVEVYASQTGIVVRANFDPGLGNNVMIDHGTSSGASLMTVYGHMTRSVVAYGQFVAVGQLIGYAGTTGASTGCHLHFETWVNGTTVNPLGLLPPF